MTDEQINEVMRLVGDVVIANALFVTGQVLDTTPIGEAHYTLNAHLRTIGEPENTFPLNPNAASKWAHLQKHDGAEAIGVVFRTGSGSVGSLVDGRVVWADWLAHPNGGKPAGDDLRWAAGVIEKYDDAIIEACYMIDSTDCAAILTALAEYRERFDSPTTKHSEPESVNAELLEALKRVSSTLETIGDLPSMKADVDAAIPRAESAIEGSPKPVTFPAMKAAFRTTRVEAGEFIMAFKFRDIEDMDRADDEWRAAMAIETPAKVSPCAGHAVQQEADEAGGA